MHSLAVDKPAGVEHPEARVRPRFRPYGTAYRRTWRLFGADRKLDLRLVEKAARHHLQRLWRGHIDALGAGEHFAHERGKPDHVIRDITGCIVDQAGQAIATSQPPGSALTAANGTQDEGNPQPAHENLRTKPSEGEIG